MQSQELLKARLIAAFPAILTLENFPQFCDDLTKGICVSTLPDYVELVFAMRQYITSGGNPGVSAEARDRIDRLTKKSTK